MSGAAEFSYFRGVAPVMWVFFALSLIELGAVHLLIATRWPAVGWPLSVLSAFGACWIVVLIRSLKTRPHRLQGEMLELNFGRLKHIALPLGDIALVSGAWEAGAVKAKDAVDLGIFAYPNRCLVLAKPQARGKRRVFIRLDDPSAFDAALASSGVPFSASGPH